MATTLVVKPILRAKKYASHERAPATPESAISIQSLDPMDLNVNPLNLCKKRLVIIKNPAIMIERIVVASVESIPFNPSLPNIATSAANSADRNAYKSHIVILVYSICSKYKREMAKKTVIKL